MWAAVAGGEYLTQNRWYVRFTIMGSVVEENYLKYKSTGKNLCPYSLWP